MADGDRRRRCWPAVPCCMHAVQCRRAGDWVSLTFDLATPTLKAPTITQPNLGHVQVACRRLIYIASRTVRHSRVVRAEGRGRCTPVIVHASHRTRCPCIMHRASRIVHVAAQRRTNARDGWHRREPWRGMRITSCTEVCTGVCGWGVGVRGPWTPIGDSHRDTDSAIAISHAAIRHCSTVSCPDADAPVPLFGCEDSAGVQQPTISGVSHGSRRRVAALPSRLASILRAVGRQAALGARDVALSRSSDGTNRRGHSRGVTGGFVVPLHRRHPVCAKQHPTGNRPLLRIASDRVAER